MRYRSGEISLRFRAIALILLILPAGVLAAARSSDLQVLGSDDRYWVAHFEATGSDSPNDPKHTVIYTRSAGEQTFSEFVDSDGHIVAMAHRGTQLAVVEQDGNWTMVSEAVTFSQGPDLPNDAKIIDLAGGGDTFWALGSAGTLAASPSTSTATTLPTTAAATSISSTTAPATTRAVAVPPSLYRLDNGKWTLVASLPAQAMAGTVPASLSIIDQTPFLAYADSPHSVHVARFDGKVWVDIAILDGTDALTGVSVPRGTAAPVVWIAREKGRYSLDFLNGPEASRNVPLSFLPPEARSVAVGYALGRIRVVVYSIKNAISEQALDPFTGVAVGTPAPVVLHVEPGMASFDRVLQFVIWGALFLSIFGAMYWRRQMQGMVFDLERLRLAPLGRRAVAGAIDLYPLFIGMLVFQRFESVAEREFVAVVSLGLYITLTALAEIFSGRSLGKWLTGLEVVSLTGERPPRWSLLVRNLLRVIDVGLFFVPLAVVMLSPLRQRTGDVAAGTLVVQSVNPPM